MTWRDVVGLEGVYQVSDTGMVRSVDRSVVTSKWVTRRLGGRMLTGARSGPGYQTVVLSYDGRTFTAYVHHLVAAAFLGPRPDGYHVCHNDGDRSNNNASNLRYGTPSDNTRDACIAGAMAHKLTEEEVRQIRHMAANTSMSQAAIGAQFGVTGSTISRVVTRKLWDWVK